MQVYYLQRFWFGNFYSNLNFPQTHYFTIAFDSPVTVKGQIFLNLLSQGFDLDAKVIGLAVACQHLIIRSSRLCCVSKLKRWNEGWPGG